MRRGIATFLILATAFLAYCSRIEDPVLIDGEIIVLSGGLLIDGTGSEEISGSIVVIEDENIIFVGADSTYSIPENAQVIDASSFTILPGFINAHVHSGHIEANLRAWAYSGVTSVRDLGNLTQSPATGFSIRDQYLLNNMNSRLVAAGPLVTTPGGYGNYAVTSVEDARNKIIYLISAGADIIKLAIEDDLQQRTWPMLSADEISMIVQTAHEYNVLASAHVSRARHLEMAIDANVDDVAHMIINYLPDSLIIKMIEQDMYWVPTLELWDGVSQLHSVTWNVMARSNLSRFIQAGGKVALGTDYDGYVTEFDLGMPFQEIALMQETGMTPMEIIVAGTKHAAHVCNLEDTLGTIEAGKLANILILKNNPLMNMDALSDVYMVIHNGEIIRESP